MKTIETYEIIGHYYPDVVSGCPIHERRSVCERIDGNRKHACDVFRANNPKYQIMVVNYMGKREEK